MPAASWSPWPERRRTRVHPRTWPPRRPGVSSFPPANHGSPGTDVTLPITICGIEAALSGSANAACSAQTSTGSSSASTSPSTAATGLASKSVPVTLASTSRRRLARRARGVRSGPRSSRSPERPPLRAAHRRGSFALWPRGAPPRTPRAGRRCRGGASGWRGRSHVGTTLPASE